MAGGYAAAEVSRSLDRKTVRRRCERLVRELGLVAPFTAQDFVSSLARQRCRRIRLMPLRLAEIGGVLGRRVETDIDDIILFPLDVTAGHRDVIILHEAVHIAEDHEGMTVPMEAAWELLPELDPTLVRRYLSRSSYHQHDEREAETLARALYRMGRVRSMPGLSPLEQAVTPVDRLSHSLE